MLYFTILFVCIGLGLGLFGFEKETAGTCIVVISVLWFFVWGPWAVATFIELVIGYSLASSFKKAIS